MSQWENPENKSDVSNTCETDTQLECDACVYVLNAVTSNNLIAVRNSLQSGEVLPNFVFGGKNLVCEAAYNGHVEMVDLLLQFKFDSTQPDMSDHMLRQPIHIAASKGHVEVLKCLQKSGVNINSQDNDHRTPLHWASTYGHTEMAQYLLSSGASVNIAQIDGFTPLHAASCLGHHKICQLLIEHSVDVNRADRDGWTALHTAVCYGQEKIVEILLNACASMKKKTKEEETAFHIASSSGRLSIMKLLYSRGANPNERNMCGYTPFHISIYYKHYDITRYLLELNVQIDTQNSAGQTPFSLACLRGEEEFILLLIHAGYNVSQLEWIHQPVLPIGLANKTSLVTLLRHLATNPKTLEELSCFRVRSLFGDHMMTDVDKLPLPSRLKDLIAYRISD